MINVNERLSALGVDLKTYHGAKKSVKEGLYQIIYDYLNSQEINCNISPEITPQVSSEQYHLLNRVRGVKTIGANILDFSYFTKDENCRQIGLLKQQDGSIVPFEIDYHNELGVKILQPTSTITFLKRCFDKFISNGIVPTNSLKMRKRLGKMAFQSFGNNKYIAYRDKRNDCQYFLTKQGYSSSLNHSFCIVGKCISLNKEGTLMTNNLNRTYKFSDSFYGPENLEIQFATNNIDDFKIYTTDIIKTSIENKILRMFNN